MLARLYDHPTLKMLERTRIQCRFYYYLDIVEEHRTGGRGSDAQLVLFLPNSQTRCVSVHYERGDTLVALQVVE